ncbi:MAG: hypothetical protein V9G04_00225 [Nocardioides sp.]
MVGAEQNRLGQYVDPAQGGQITGAAQQWRDGAKALRAVHEKLSLAIPEVKEGVKTETGMAALTAMQATAQRALDRAVEMESAAQALDRVVTKIDHAESKLASMRGAPLTAPPSPSYPPDQTPQEAADTERQYNNDKSAYDTAVGNRELEAKQAADDVDKEMAAAAVVMSKIHGEGDSEDITFSKTGASSQSGWFRDPTLTPIDTGNNPPPPPRWPTPQPAPVDPNPWDPPTWPTDPHPPYLGDPDPHGPVDPWHPPGYDPTNPGDVPGSTLAPSPVAYDPGQFDPTTDCQPETTAGYGTADTSSGSGQIGPGGLAAAGGLSGALGAGALRGLAGRLSTSAVAPSAIPGTTAGRRAYGWSRLCCSWGRRRRPGRHGRRHGGRQSWRYAWGRCRSGRTPTGQGQEARCLGWLRRGRRAVDRRRGRGPRGPELSNDLASICRPDRNRSGRQDCLGTIGPGTIGAVQQHDTTRGVS